MGEETIDLRTILPHFNIPIRLDNLFTDQEQSGDDRFSFMDLSLKAEGNNNTNKMAVTITSLTSDNESNIPTFEINDSDEDVIFIAEYSSITPNVASEISPPASYPSRIESPISDSSSSSITSLDSSPKATGSKPPRRNPTRSARSSKYKRKCSDYITEEDLSVLIASDEESSAVEMIDNDISISKETHPKKLVVNTWPAEGLHERPEYNEQTEEIEKFDYSIRKIQNSIKSAKQEKPKKLKAPKKKYVPKKYCYRRKQNKRTEKKQEIEMTPFGELSGLINDTFKLLSESFLKTVVASKRAGLHKCRLAKTDEDKENGNFLSIYNEIMSHQSQLYFLANEEVNFEDTYHKLKTEFENEHI